MDNSMVGDSGKGVQVGNYGTEFKQDTFEFWS